MQEGIGGINGERRRPPKKTETKTAQRESLGKGHLVEYSRFHEAIEMIKLRPKFLHMKNKLIWGVQEALSDV